MPGLKVAESKVSVRDWQEKRLEKLVKNQINEGFVCLHQYSGQKCIDIVGFRHHSTSKSSGVVAMNRDFEIISIC